MFKKPKRSLMNLFASVIIFGSVSVFASLGFNYTVQGVITSEWTSKKQSEYYNLYQKIFIEDLRGHFYQEIFGEGLREDGLADTDKDRRISLMEKAIAYERMGIKYEDEKPTLEQLRNYVRVYEN